MTSNNQVWETKTIGDFVSVKRGYDLTSKQRNAGTIPVYGAAGQNGVHNEIKAKAPGIVIGRSGGSFGKVHFVSKDFWPHNTAMYVTDFKGNDPDFSYYLLKLLDFSALNSGSAQPSLNRNYLYPVKIKAPIPSVQRVIGKILKNLDEKIELNNKINAELEAMAKLIYDYWFVQFDFPDAEGKPYKSSGGKMVYNEELKREIPDGWGINKLSHNLNIYDSMRIPMSKKERETKKGRYPYFGATSIMDYVDDFIFDDEYILVAEDGSIMDDKGMPIVQFIWGKTWVNNHAHVLQAKEKEQNEFYYQTLKRIPVVLIKTGSIQLKINQANLMNYKVLSPPEAIVNKYSELADSMRKKLVGNVEETNKLTELRDWLLPMLMNGQVTVN